MGNAKNIVLRPMGAKTANTFMKRVHYSGKVVNNSQLHIGVYYEGVLGGVIQYGCSMVKKNMVGLVKGTGWNEFIELNRLAFTDLLPRNSESRAISISLKLLRRHAPHIKWVISFADATQCGDGTIYRASGFVLTKINKTSPTRKMPDGTLVSRMTMTKGKHILKNGGAKWSDNAIPLKGFQLRYIYFIDKSYRQKLTVPEIPFSKIKEMGAGMYKGKVRR